MKNKTTLLFSLFIAFTLISIKPKAQTTCDCWKTRDASFTEYPYTVDISGPTPVSPYYRNDDAYGSTILTLPFSFCFYGTPVNQIYVDMNGFVTWGNGAASMYGGSSSYEPQTLPLPAPAFIAPFWSDEDSRNLTGPGTGLVWYKVTPTYVIFQWDTVNYFGTSNSAQDNSFQLIISNGTDPIIPNGNNIEFCYGQMTWSAGTAQGAVGGFGSPNNPGLAGINEGNGTGNIQYGQFNSANNSYVGPYPPSSSYDGVYWLDNREFFMNGCTGNASPFEMSGGSACDTLKICEGDTIKTSYWFYSVIPHSTVTTVLSSAPSGVSIIYNQSYGSEDSVVIQIIGNSTNTGVHTISLYSFDNVAPPDSLLTTFIIDIEPGPAVTISAAPDTICLGSSSVLTAGGGITYLWSNGATNASITVTPTTTTTYSVAIATASCTKDTEVTVVVEPPLNLQVTPPNTGVCSGDSIALTASGATTYSWTPNTGLNCYTCSNPNASPTVTTVYTITGTANGCSATITDTVKSYPTPTVTVTASADTICVGSPDTLTASGATTYTWAPSTGLSCTSCANPVATPSVNTTYTVIGKTANNCTNSATVSVHVFPLPVLSVTPNQSVCPGSSVTLIASGDGSNYTWNPGNISGPSISVTPAITTIYTVTMTSGCGTVSANVTVYVNPQPVPLIGSALTQGCAPLCVQFYNRSTISSTRVSGWAWDFGNGDTSLIENPLYCYQNPGVFSVKLTVTSDSGCSATLVTNNYITVYSHPNPAFNMSPNPASMLQPTIQFTDNSTDAYGIAAWNWSFGDATDSTAYTQNASHTYQDTGTYCAELVVTNIHGCVDSTNNCIAINPIYALYIPSGFTPNGNGRNDIFQPKGNDIKSFEMYIFDRWGMQLFHSTDINNGWNGAVNGSGTICQEDTYVYLITVYDSKNIKHSYTGSVNLIK